MSLLSLLYLFQTLLTSIADNDILIENFKSVTDLSDLESIFGLTNVTITDDYTMFTLTTDGTSEPMLMKMPLDGTRFFTETPVNYKVNIYNMGDLLFKFSCGSDNTDIPLRFQKMYNLIYIVSPLDANSVILIGSIHDKTEAELEFDKKGSLSIYPKNENLESVGDLPLEKCPRLGDNHVLVNLTIQWSDWKDNCVLKFQKDIFLKSKPSLSTTTALATTSETTSKVFYYESFPIPVMFSIIFAYSAITGIVLGVFLHFARKAMGRDVFLRKIYEIDSTHSTTRTNHKPKKESKHKKNKEKKHSKKLKKAKTSSTNSKDDEEKKKKSPKVSKKHTEKRRKASKKKE